MTRWRRISILAWMGLWSLCNGFPAGAQGEVARIGFNVKIARDLNRGDVQAALSLWGEELSKKFGVPTEMLYYDDMLSLRRDLDAGKVNFVIAAGMDFARHFKPGELTDGFRGAIQNDHTLLLLTRRDAGIGSLKGLAGKRVALLKDDELSEVYLETLCLGQYRRPCKQVFGAIEAVANSNQLIMRLVFGKADAVLSKRIGYETARELNPQIGNVAVELTRFPLKSSYYGLYSRKVSPAFQERSLKRTPEMHKDIRGRQVLEVFKIDRLELANADELRPFYELLAEYDTLRAGVPAKRVDR
ncbi:MAG: PhnD/SsuA/transferrin family substrate-binding protein [Hydrogenophilales bacterium]|nr:PhnD/SsuA/transferrin family substrate-binding protein [Hydrogenophilales bacterium]